MSLLHRTTSIESFPRRGSLAESLDPRPRKLSFSPISISSDPAAHKPSFPSTNPPDDSSSPNTGIDPSKIPRATRIAQVAIAVLYCLVAAGPVFGYAAIKQVFIAEGVYAHLCPSGTADPHRACYEQDLRLDFMFTLSAVSTNVCALPVGALLDRRGPRVASLVGCVLIALGALCLALAADAAASPHRVDAYVPGYLLLALGGPFVFIPAFHLSNAFPSRPGLVLALLTGAFDSSSAVFLFYRLAYARSAGHLAPRTFFLAYLAVPACIAIAQLTLMPARSYKTAGELAAEAHVDGDADGHDTAAAADTEETAALLDTPAPTTPTNTVTGALHGLSATAQLRTPWFALAALFTALQMLRINHYVATVRAQATYILHDPALGARVNDLFDAALPLGGVVAIPFIGLVLDGLSTAVVLWVLVVLATGIGVLGVVPVYGAQAVGVVLFTLYRPLYYTAIS